MKKSLILILTMALLWSCGDQYKSASFILIDEADAPDEIIAKAAHVVPGARQLAWQDLEFTAFCHFGINTFTNREWGNGQEDPALFNPTDFDADQWVTTFKEAGLKMVIVTAKHHDGFCLWPSAYTDHSVASSPWMNGTGDVVKAVKEACERHGLKFGVYLSPWDRHEQQYGTEEYNTYFVNQLTELLTNYGVVDEVWFDGANGEGPNGKRQVYDWIRYYKTIRKLQPDAVIAIMGPDVRWVGTESGYGRVMEWSVVPYDAQDNATIAENSQQAATEGVFIPLGDKMAKDLGSRSKIINASALVWYPSEVDVSIRPGWFYHASQDEQVKTPEKLLDIWFSSVGRNSLLLLNIPPDTRGRIHENDVKALLDLKTLRDVIFAENLAAGARVKASNGKGVAGVLTEGRSKSWMAKKGEREGDLVFELGAEKSFDCMTVCENIELGQRVEQFSLDVWTGERWKEVTRSTTIGNKRLIRFSTQTSDKVRLRILQARWTPSISYFALHKRPPELEMNPDAGAFMSDYEVELKTDVPSTKIYFTIDGSDPGANSDLYTGPIKINETTTIKAVAIDERGVKSFIREGNYSKATFTINYEISPSSKYPAKTPIVLMDGRQGILDHASGEWLGWEGDDMEATIDFGQSKSFTSVRADFLHSPDNWIFAPIQVEFEVSSNGTVFYPMGKDSNFDKWNASSGNSRKEFKASKAVAARYLRVKVKSLGVCPPGHAGAGGPAWLFCDEIWVD